MKKRIMTVVLALAMAVSLSACGSKSDVKAGNEVTLTMDEIQDKMTEAITNVKSVDADLDIDLDFSMEMGGQNGSLKANLDGEAQAVISNQSFHVKGNGSISTEGLGQYSVEDVNGTGELEAYAVTDADQVTRYITTDGKEWITSGMSQEEFMANMAGMLDEIIVIETLIKMDLKDNTGKKVNIQGILDNFTPALQSKTVKAAGKECYEISTTINKNSLAAIPEMEEYVTMLEMFDVCEAKCAIYIDVATNLPVKMEMTADFSAEDDTMGIRMNLKECKFSLELEYDTVDTIEVPGKVKDSAVAGNWKGLTP